METPVGFLLAATAFLLPAIPRFHFGLDGWSPFIIQYLPNFWAINKAGLLSENDLGSMELFVAVYILGRLSYFPLFWHHYATRFSSQNPPPRELERGWPAQIVGAFRFGGVFLAASIALGPLAYFLNALSQKYEFCILEVFACGLMFLTEGALGVALRSRFRAKFWRE